MLIVKLYLTNLLYCLIFFLYLQNRKGTIQNIVTIDVEAMQ